MTSGNFWYEAESSVDGLARLAGAAFSMRSCKCSLHRLQIAERQWQYSKSKFRRKPYYLNFINLWSQIISLAYHSPKKVRESSLNKISITSDFHPEKTLSE